MDAHGNSLEFQISDDVTHDVKIAPELLKKVGLKGTHILNADKGYDSEELRTLIAHPAVHANIPRKRNSLQRNDHMDWHLYQSRLVVENAFARSEHFRAIATCFDKLKNSYVGAVVLACAYIWLKL